MKKILPPDTELKNIDASLNTGERHILWLSFATVFLILVLLVVWKSELRGESIKKESPKRELQADFNAY